ncbi:MAG: hypothetical protein ACM3O7_10420 [Acidobacteriota bacterium]
MAAKANPKSAAVLAVLLVVLVGVFVLRVLPVIEERSSTSTGGVPELRQIKVPRLGTLALADRELAAPSSTRNLFTFGAPPTPTPDLRPTPTPAPTLPPRPIPTPTPAGILLPDGRRLPPPPVFTAAFLGWLGPARLPIAVFRDGGDVLAVPQGGEMKGLFIVRAVTPTGVRIGYEGYPEDVTTVVPLSR